MDGAHQAEKGGEHLSARLLFEVDAVLLGNGGKLGQRLETGRETTPRPLSPEQEARGGEEKEDQPPVVGN